MAGMKGFRHNCMTEKHCKEKNTFKNSIFSYAQIDMIWDFYVTHSICGTSKLERKTCCINNCTTHHTDKLFTILKKNKFNLKDAKKKFAVLLNQQFGIIMIAAMSKLLNGMIF